MHALREKVLHVWTEIVEHGACFIFLSCQCVQENMMFVHKEQADFPAALQLEREVLEIRRGILGSDHPKTAKAQRLIADLEDKLGSR